MTHTTQSIPYSLTGLNPSPKIRWWYALAAPPVPPDAANLPLRDREFLRRGKLNSFTMLFQLLVLLLAFIPAAQRATETGPLVVLNIAVAIILLIISILLNRAGKLLRAGILLILGIEMTLIPTLLFDGPEGLETHTVTVIYLLVYPLLIAVLTLPTWGVIITAAFNIIVTVVILTVYPESSAFHTLMRISPVPMLFTIVPISVQFFCASLCSIVVRSLRESLVRAEQADEIQYLYQEQEHLATTDSVTDLLNHRALRQRLQEVLAHGQGSCALLFVDLDHFKHINDRWGHAVGDAVLHEVARRLQQVVLNNRGIVGRYGGEEFAVVLPEIDLPLTLQVAKQMRLALARSAYLWQASEQDECISIPITASIGVALFPLHATNENTLWAAADQAMYCAKQQGRNRVCLAGVCLCEQPPPPSNETRIARQRETGSDIFDQCFPC